MSRAIAVFVALALAAPAAAAPVVIYRCVAADGSVTIQNDTRCPKGTRAQRRVLEAPAPAPPRATPAPTPAPAAVAPVMPVPVPADTPPPPAEAPTALLPPPLLHSCLTADAQRYYSDEPEASRCAPLTAVGLDGRSPTDAQACELVQDRCAPVPEAERCAAWAERRAVAERALLFAPEQVDQARAELARIEAATTGTACGR